MDNARSPSPRVPLCRLWRRTSKAGRTYYVGRLGSAKVLAFELAAKAEGDPALELVLVPAEPRPGAPAPSPTEALRDRRPVAGRERDPAAAVFD